LTGERNGKSFDDVLPREKKKKGTIGVGCQGFGKPFHKGEGCAFGSVNVVEIQKRGW